jgi:error-prone DNA polymerase
VSSRFPWFRCSPHLHVHSWFSFGAGVSSPEVLARQAAARGFTALACTDTNGVYGAVEFQQAALAHGLRPIHGAHLVHGGQEVVALATDERGMGGAVPGHHAHPLGR